MQITFPTGERVSFSWRESGSLHVDLLKADTVHGKWLVTASTDVAGDPLVEILEGFTLPLLRRALLGATKYNPKER